MNTETPTPTAAELLRAYYKLKIESDAYETFGCADAMEQIEFDATMQKIDAISAQLDEMCERLDIQDGAFAFLVEMPSAPDKVRKELMGELIALLQWLLIKENHEK